MTAEECYYRGIDLFGAGKLEEAIGEYEQALQLDPRFVDALHGLAQAYYAKNEFDQCICTARRILALDPEDILAHTSMSRAYQKKGMIAEAEAAKEKASQLSEQARLGPEGRSGAQE